MINAGSPALPLVLSLPYNYICKYLQCKLLIMLESLQKVLYTLIKN